MYYPGSGTQPLGWAHGYASYESSFWKRDSSSNIEVTGPLYIYFKMYQI